MKCPNCNATLSCGCQRRTASDGKGCCSSCVSAYEQKLIFNKTGGAPITPAPVSTNNVWGVNRYVNTKK